MGAGFVMVGADDRGGGFDLLLGERVILSHRVEAPALRIAKGDPTVTMVRGNFRHEDAPSDERVPRWVAAYRPEAQCVALTGCRWHVRFAGNHSRRIHSCIGNFM
ncbi:MAG: hypothetical protein HC774_02195, partial [Sphingomonadales bacterium]|nr:hypothetical protein [Sphingomonadales bacterium]